MARVLVSDGEQRAALAVVRSLGRQGHFVVVAAAAKRSLAGSSRFCSQRLVVPDPLRDPDAFVTAVERAVRDYSIEYVLPVTEAAHLAILPRRHMLHPAVVPGPSWEAFTRAADKDAVLRAAASLDLAIPRQVVIAGRRAVESSRLDVLRYPVVVKPSRSVGQADGRREKFSVRHVTDQSELAGILASLPEAGFPVLVQERIVGPGIGIFLLRTGGRIVARFAHRRIREKPPSGGVSVLSQAVVADPVLVVKAERLIENLGWEGVAMVEFKIDSTSRQPYLMEVNGRFWGSLQLAIDAGVDFPRLLLDGALGKAAPLEPPAWQSGRRSRWLWGDIDHLLLRLLRSREVLSLPPDAPSRSRALLAFFDWRPWRDRDAIFRLGDPMPFLHESMAWFRAL